VVNTKELRAYMVRKELTQKEVAEKLNISEKTFYLRMKNGVFGSDEIEALIDLLGIDDPMSVFFAQTVT
jgi:transcriptional regulator with XRE-family HTH domain